MPSGLLPRWRGILKRHLKGNARKAQRIAQVLHLAHILVYFGAWYLALRYGRELPAVAQVLIFFLLIFGAPSGDLFESYERAGERARSSQAISGVAGQSNKHGGPFRDEQARGQRMRDFGKPRGQ